MSKRPAWKKVVYTGRRTAVVVAASVVNLEEIFGTPSAKPGC